MRTLLVTTALAVTAAMVMTAAPGTAFHGAPYTALGTAELAGKIFNAKMVWTGVGAQGVGTYRIEIKEGATVVHKNTVQGQEMFTNVRFVNQDGCGSYEIVDYHGYDVTSGGTILQLEGFQENNLCTGKAYMEYYGHYLMFKLDLVVWTAL